MLARGYILGCLPISSVFNVAERRWALEFLDIIKMVCLDHFIRFFNIPKVDFYSLPVHLEPYALRILQLNLSMRENMGDQQWISPFEPEFARKQAQPRIKALNPQPQNCASQSFGHGNFSSFLCRGMKFQMPLSEIHQAH